MVAQSDRITLSVLIAHDALDRWTIDDVMEILEHRFGDDAPSRRTVRNRLAGLEEVGVLTAHGGGGRSYKRYRLNSELTDNISNPDQ